MPPLLLSPSAAAPPPPPLRLVNPEDDDIAVWKWVVCVCWAGRIGPEFVVGRNDSIANRQAVECSEVAKATSGQARGGFSGAVDEVLGSVGEPSCGRCRDRRYEAGRGDQYRP